MKKVVVLGGGTGLSTLLRGLKQFPIDLTAIVTVSDDGSSTGKLRKEFNIPAVGDIRQVITALSETEPLLQKLLNYRFKTNSDLNGHALGNLLLTGLIDTAGSFSKGIESLQKVLNIKGKVLPLTEENVTLTALMEDGVVIYGENNITKYKGKIKKIKYKSNPKVLPQVTDEIINADLIILSMGSLFTSIIPNLICEDVINAIDKSKAKILYVCNLVSQPGETDNFKASDHVITLNEYLGNKKVSAILANTGSIKINIKKTYETLEKKIPIQFDKKNLKKLNLEIMSDNFVEVIDGSLRHNALKLGFYIYSYLMFKEK